jgi:folate-dependent phosphoribosylglycinamide formyltransferase PurN
MTKKSCRVAVLLSGGGTTMVNLQDHIDSGEVPAEIVVVVSSRKNVLGVERAQKLGLETRVLGRSRSSARDDSTPKRIRADWWSYSSPITRISW